ncbi:ribose-phosphate pyrophosphokinase [Variovorax sp. RA8]|uniref:ribose-phosphate pyrophosphokinase n=1 Tax=Variovorax sp. (strain JCM 16519 / RA8) TaxID=662548 RepID=UPI0013172697|nr:ribose-phosphate pyrophosphokinase [Variovorax sp. RA8]VTU44611.1 Ribose-phosphate pyrophosphokinase [Variovorax sp. RA8]
MKPVVVAMPGNEQLADDLAAHLSLERGAATVRRFPDGESYARVESAIEGRVTLIACTLDRPDDKLVPLLLLSAAVREAGALSVGLVAPYLPYMRQDRRFHPGETISAQHVGAWISHYVDWMVTVDPHLHRIPDLSQVYSVPSRVVHAADSVAQWVRAQVRNPLLIGPDEESAQWVSDVAQQSDAPFVVLTKTRRGDRDVQVSVPDVERWRSHTPVLVDDIVSTARTMIETIDHLRRAGLAAPVCVAVHAVFAQTAFEELRAAGAGDIVSCDTIRHASNRISLTAAIAAGVRVFLP